MAGVFLAGAFFDAEDLVGVAFAAGLVALFFAAVALVAVLLAEPLALGLLAAGLFAAAMVFFVTDFFATLLAAALLAALDEALFFCEAAGRLDTLRRAPPTDFPFFGGIF